MASIREVAAMAGVSVATVSRALAAPDKVSEATKKKVFNAIDASGYKPNLLARNFRSSRSYCLVVMVPDITNPFYAPVIKAIEDRAQQRGYAVLLGDTRDDHMREQEQVKRVETRLADDLIQLRPSEVIMEASPIPVVYACGCQNIDHNSVIIDNELAAQKIVEYLISLGHTRIAALTGLRENPHTGERLAGYQAALAKAGISLRSDYILEGDFTMSSGQDTAARVMAVPEPPTALFCMSDQMAMGAIQALQARGIKVPSDVSVAGFDNIEYSAFWHPAITTVSQPVEEMGKRVVDMLLSVIEGEPMKAANKILPTQLIVRESTGPA